MEIDDLDRRIIDQLRVDGRRSFGEIGRSVGLSEASVRARYGRLQRRGVLQVVGMTDARLLGEVEVHLAIRVQRVPLAFVARELSRLAEVRYVASCVGPYDLITDVRCRDLAHLAELLTERVRRINGVEYAEALTVLEVVKDTYLWAGFRDVTPTAAERILPR
ncbi:Lrp/AsnC family transcriptional regulator [Peterkaempfera bronchialis]|uniref:Lrp/AsnC family transcriptional regulator n=1 Tax=Peterkaempfera bronchialis TaxID=2126346 RepID=A0A345SWT8_9ACTN|nr:Lrp/AsnC family transcriptional regulator [Peterkaempfera bronchialis]AXI78193.1 Lrp/AsnC family transcriptional regulator [Peterkaempfera bronchialis]